MAHIHREIDKGICTACFGSGEDESFKIGEFPMQLVTKRQLTAFDLNKCQVCNGSGRIIKIE